MPSPYVQLTDRSRGGIDRSKFLVVSITETASVGRIQTGVRRVEEVIHTPRWYFGSIGNGVGQSQSSLSERHKCNRARILLATKPETAVAGVCRSNQ